MFHIPCVSWGWSLFDYKDQNEYLLNNIDKGLSNEALQTIKEVCHNKFTTKENTNTLVKEQSPCFLVYDGRTFVKGVASGNEFKRISIERYGIKAIEWAIPNKMYDYLSGNGKSKSIDLFYGDDKLSIFFRENFEYSKRLCGFSD